METLDLLFKGAAAAVLLALPILLVNWFRYMRQVNANRSLRPHLEQGTIPAKSVMFFVLSIGTVMCVASISQNRAHDEVLKMLGSMPADATVSVNGKIAPDRDVLMQTLQTLHWQAAHHSHPARAIHIEISAPGRHLALVLKRDSSNPQEYWVFLPRYMITSKNEIGRINSGIFEAY
ncbi:MAG: hypothetical protein ACFUZC_00705 [Chthoniobacteraceae bacterium]